MEDEKILESLPASSLRSQQKQPVTNPLYFQELSGSKQFYEDVLFSQIREMGSSILSFELHSFSLPMQF